MLLGPVCLPAIGRGVSEADSGFRVGWRTVGWSFFASVNKAFILAGGMGAGLSFYRV